MENTMAKINPYTWLLTVILGFALADASSAVAGALLYGEHTGDALERLLARYCIFIVLCIRWGIGAIWLLNLGYERIVQPSIDCLRVSIRYFREFVVGFFNFLTLSFLALTLPNPQDSSFFADVLNRLFFGESGVTNDFWWILFGFCAINTIYLFAISILGSRFDSVNRVRLAANGTTLGTLIIVVLARQLELFTAERALGFFLVVLLLSTLTVVFKTVIRTRWSDRTVAGFPGLPASSASASAAGAGA